MSTGPSIPRMAGIVSPTNKRCVRTAGGTPKIRVLWRKRPERNVSIFMLPRLSRRYCPPISRKALLIGEAIEVLITALPVRDAFGLMTDQGGTHPDTIAGNYLDWACTRDVRRDSSKKRHRIEYEWFNSYLDASVKVWPRNSIETT